MNILAVTYQNIGPFQNKLITINFKLWKYLIKAPIGSWKSFLFFDWPVFGLYKYSARNMLNSKSLEWFVKIFFEANWDYFMVERQIKWTKSWWESVASRLYRIEDWEWKTNEVSPDFSWIENLNDIINFDIDISEILKNHLEEITFKSQTELQNSLDDFLPPREVFLNTNFLMQESENVFDMTAADRINVFKNIFWLIWIDSAKDIISDEKKQVQLNLKLKADTTSYDKKLKDNIASIMSIKNTILSEQIKLDLLKNDVVGFFSSSIFTDFELIWDNVNINLFDLAWVDFQKIDSINSNIEKIKSDYQNLLGKYETTKLSNQSNLSKIDQLNSEKNKNISEISQIEDHIKKFDESHIESLKTQKSWFISSQTALVESIDFVQINSFWYQTKDIFEAVNLIDSLINDWKTLKLQLEDVENKISQLDKDKQRLEQQLSDFELKPWTDIYAQYQNHIEALKKDFNANIQNIDLQISHIVEKKSNYYKQISSLTGKITEISKDYDSQSTFYCEKITTNCPFVIAIKWSSLEIIWKQKLDLQKEYDELLVKVKSENFEGALDELEKAKQKFLNDLSQLEKKPTDFMKEFFEKLDSKKQIISQQIKDLNYETLLNNYNRSKDEISHSLSKIKDFFAKIDWKTIKNSFESYKEFDIKIKKIDQEISVLEQEVKKISEYKEKIIYLKSSIESIDKQLSELNLEIEKIQKEIQNLDMQLKLFDIDSIYKLEKSIKTLSDLFKDIWKLVEEYKFSQIEVKKLKEDEEMLTNLYQIFSKELMLVVLQDFLPSLQDVINNLLAQVVDYEIKFDLIKKSSDKLELDIQIFDNKWLRSVKSLSWWQRTILKLVWMLAISSMMRVKFLFLDETINNLDNDTVGRVSELIEDFVAANDLKFYVVTHSEQIQQMDIWDETVEVAK